MTSRSPITRFSTHDVANQSTVLADYNLYDTDHALKEALNREGAGWAEDRVRALGDTVGSRHMIALGASANRHVPVLNSFAPDGSRIDEVEFHPAYHELMAAGIEHEVHSIAWNAKRTGGHVAHAALEYLLTQAEAGICCPITMTYASVPALRNQPEIAAEWEPRILSKTYDPNCLPAAEKHGATIGMAMTEKQGGSDVRANTTRARSLGSGGPGAEYELTGHKWFCSAPMSDAFLTLANTDAGLSCFLMPRWRPDGMRNRIFLQRLKDKLGNRSNASAEIEYDGAWARMVGEEGRGVRTIMEMVQHTRLDASAAPAGMMRQAVVQAVHHAAHRKAFGRLLIDQPLMRNVLADMVIESEAATALVMRVARAFDEAGADMAAQAFARVAVAVTKYWVNKRLPNLTYEAMECHGGNGYVEDSMMPRLYREAPVNSIWEGSGNVICLDVLRAMQRAPESAAIFIAELEIARGGDERLDGAIGRLKETLSDKSDLEIRARRVTEDLALTLQGALLMQFAPSVISEAFCASRLSNDRGRSYGTLPAGLDFAGIIERARVD